MGAPPSHGARVTYLSRVSLTARRAASRSVKILNLGSIPYNFYSNLPSAKIDCDIMGKSALAATGLIN